MSELLALVLAFAFGSIPFGLLLMRWSRGIDLRQVGSGNIGATNALRAGGTKLGVATLLLDAAKAVAGLSVASWLLRGWPHGWIEAALVVAPVAGHCYSPWLRWHGGKGVATAAGVLSYVDPRLLIAGLFAFLALVLPTRLASLGSIGACVAVALAAPLVDGWSGLTAGILIAEALILLRHRENLVRLWRGTERRIGDSGPTASRI
jgi:glycerol-3-phosphate acyltransferase PlsY